MAYSPGDIAFERAGTGPAMLLVHGCPATHTLWRPLVPSLSEHRTLYAVDLPGFGGSRAPDDPDALSLPGLVDLLLRFADHHDIGQFDIVGHSFGAALSASIAAESPDRVRSLVMIAPLGIEAPPAVRFALTRTATRVAAPLWRAVPSPVRRAGVRAATRVNYGPAYVAERAREIAGELDRSDALHAICRLVGAFDFDEYRSRLESLGRGTAVPAMAIGAGSDRVIPHRHFAELCDVVKPVVQQSYADGVHVVLWQHSADIARSIVSFVEQSSLVASETRA